MNGTGSARCIWIISKYASSREYGFETRPFTLAREFAKQRRTTVVISSDSNHFAAFPPLESAYKHEVIDGCVVRWIRTYKYQKTASIRRVLSWFDFEWKLFQMPKQDLPRPDIIIVSSLSLLTILTGVWLRTRYRCRLIFEIRDIWPLTLVEEGGFSRWNPFTLFLGCVERFGYRHADLVVGTMPNLTAHVINVAGPGIACECVPFGFDPSFYEPAEPESLHSPERSAPPGRFVVGYAGSIGVTNALDTIVACVKALQDDDRFFFLFIGDGDCREQYVAETKGLTNVAFIGRVERARVQSLLWQCDLVYFAVHDSTVWRYGMSLNKLIDYMMAGKPILGSYGGYPSMLNEAGCGEFVPAGSVPALEAALVRFAEMPAERRAEMGMSGRRWLIENRPWSLLAQRYLGLCDELCAPPSTADRAPPLRAG